MCVQCISIVATPLLLPLTPPYLLPTSAMLLNFMSFYHYCM